MVSFNIYTLMCILKCKIQLKFVLNSSEERMFHIANIIRAGVLDWNIKQCMMRSRIFFMPLVTGVPLSSRRNLGIE